VQLYAAVMERILGEIETESCAPWWRAARRSSGSTAGSTRWSIFSARAVAFTTVAAFAVRGRRAHRVVGRGAGVNQTLARIIDAIGNLLREGMARGAARRQHSAHAAELDRPDHLPLRLRDFGAELLRRPVFSPPKCGGAKTRFAPPPHGLVVRGAPDEKE